MFRLLTADQAAEGIRRGKRSNGDAYARHAAPRYGVGDKHPVDDERKNILGAWGAIAVGAVLGVEVLPHERDGKGMPDLVNGTEVRTRDPEGTGLDLFLGDQDIDKGDRPYVLTWAVEEAGRVAVDIIGWTWGADAMRPLHRRKNGRYPAGAWFVAPTWLAPIEELNGKAYAAFAIRQGITWRYVQSLWPGSY